MSNQRELLMKTRKSRRRTSGRCPAGERGVALILALLIALVLSTMAAGVMFTTQTEVWGSASYRGAEQARYIAEVGAQRAANWLQATYAPTSAILTDLQNTAKYDLTKYPIVSLASTKATGFTSNTNLADLEYYDSTGALACSSGSTCFSVAVATLPSDFALPGVKVDVSAQLLSAYNSGTVWNLKWKIDSRGSVGIVKPATAQVTEIFFQQVTPGGNGTAPPFNYGVFATSPNCNSISMSGGQYTESYSSQATGNVGNANPTVSLSGGNVGTFGNLKLTNGAYIYGDVYAPGYNVINNSATVPWAGVSGGGAWPYYDNSQSCSASTKYAVNEDNSGSKVGCSGGNSSSKCTDKAYNIPSPVTASTFATPTMPSVASNPNSCSGYSGLCNGGSGNGNYGNPPTITLSPSCIDAACKTAGSGPINYGNVTFAANAVINLQAGVYNMETLNITAGASIVGPSNGYVVINILNNVASSTPLNVNGGTMTNGGGDPNNLSIAYAGSNTVNLTAGSNMFATIYAPNAPITVSGNAGFYGGVVGSTVSFAGSGHVVYDTHLASESTHVPIPGGGAQTGPLHLDQFSWTMNYTPKE
jgi:hypothetical protein